MKVSIKGLNKCAVLAALFNASKPQGLGFLHYNAKPMTEAEAEVLLEQTTYFDYLQGRVMKIKIEGDEIDTWGYDRDNGEGAVEKVIATLRETGNPNAEAIKVTHVSNTRSSAVDAEIGMNVPIPPEVKARPRVALI
jgi:hypothetical protein